MDVYDSVQNKHISNVAGFNWFLLLLYLHNY